MHGILNILKPAGMTSHDVVVFIRRLTGVRKCGHTGTLDPGAAGVLPICVGQATRIAEYCLEMEKSYRAEITLGTATDTEDASGTVLKQKEVGSYTEAQIDAVLKSFLGWRLQTPPMYSAVKIAGQKLYERARKGETIPRPARQIHIFKVTFLSYRENKIMFDVTCSRGTYIRTLCREIAEALGTVGHMSFLLRTKVGPFTLQEAYTLEELCQLHEKNNLKEALLPLDTALYHLPAINLDTKAAKAIKNGRAVPIDSKTHDSPLFRVYGPKQEFLALAKVSKNMLLPQKVFLYR
ncbi:MAG: tRNA pseudouridine(55) synthase TruB [Firmicutes bacterium]|nr:tRNA pseudouridine(55) synthase TruB [Bacillota bacterium]